MWSRNLSKTARNMFTSHGNPLYVYLTVLRRPRVFAGNSDGWEHRSPMQLKHRLYVTYQSFLFISNTDKSCTDKERGCVVVGEPGSSICFCVHSYVFVGNACAFHNKRMVDEVTWKKKICMILQAEKHLVIATHIFIFLLTRELPTWSSPWEEPSYP
jgi:hypothetical protein